MKSFNTLMTGLEGVVMLSESPSPDNYNFRFKDGVAHPEVSSATVQSHSKGHDVNFVYQGHHVRASAATKVGNDPTSSSSNGFFRSLHITKGKKFDDKKLVYSHGAGSLKVDKEKVDKEKVNKILPHVRNITEHLIRHSDRELQKHLKTQNNTLKEAAEPLHEDVDHKKAVNAAWDGNYDRFMKHMGIQKHHKETDHVFVKADAHYHRLVKMPEHTKREDAIKSLSEDFNDGWEHFGEDTTEPAGSQNEQDVPTFHKQVNGDFLKLFFAGDASKANGVLSALKRAGKLKDYSVIGNMIMVEFHRSESNHHLVMQGLHAVGVTDKGDVRKSETEGATSPKSDSPAQGEDHVRKVVK